MCFVPRDRVRSAASCCQSRALPREPCPCIDGWLRPGHSSERSQPQCPGLANLPMLLQTGSGSSVWLPCRKAPKRAPTRVARLTHLMARTGAWNARFGSLLDGALERLLAVSRTCAASAEALALGCVAQGAGMPALAAPAGVMIFGASSHGVCVCLCSWSCATRSIPGRVFFARQ